MRVGFTARRDQKQFPEKKQTKQKRKRLTKHKTKQGQLSVSGVFGSSLCFVTFF